MTSFVRWVRDNDQPPASVVPKIADGTMIPPEQVRFPAIQANTYGGVARPAISAGPRIYNQLRVYDRGPQYRPGDTSGIATLEPPVPGNATYGVLVPKTDADGRVLSALDGTPIPGLYAAGEMVGGLFYTNYPGGSGLMSGAVFGRTAGASAARSIAG